MLNAFVCYSILAKVMPDHFRLDAYLGKFLSVVNMNSEAYHVRQNYHVPNMRPELTFQLAFACELYFFSQLSLFVIHISANALVKRPSLPRIQKGQQVLDRKRLKLFRSIAFKLELTYQLDHSLFSRRTTFKSNERHARYTNPSFVASSRAPSGALNLVNAFFPLIVLAVFTLSTSDS